MKTILSLAAICVVAAPTFADDKPRRGAEFRQKVLEQFDANKDGKLDEAEREKAKAEFARRRGAAKDRPNPEAAQKRFQEILAKFDKDGDGRLNEEEKAAARKSFAGKRPKPNAAAGARMKEIIAKFDKDGDGKLNDEERAAARKAMAGQFAARRKEIVKKFDKDGDGKLDEAEKAALQKHFQELRAKRAAAGGGARPKTDAARKPRVNAEVLKKFDKDGDGKLSPDERKAAIKAARAKKDKE